MILGGCFNFHLAGARRAVSLLWILFASFAILAHAVVPHHHHNGNKLAAIANVFDKEWPEKLLHKHEEGSHHHHGPHQSEDCVTNEAGVVDTKSFGDQHHLVPDLPTFDLYLTGFLADVPQPTLTEWPDGSLFPPCPESIRLRHIESHIGFRAPPFCV